MSRRMMSPQEIIKSQIADDKFQVDLNEILEKYGTVTEFDGKVITLQIYNKIASDEAQNTIYNDNDFLMDVVVNGSITISKKTNDDVYIQGMLLDNNFVLTQYLEIPSGSYENGILLQSVYEFDLYVIRV